MAILKEATVNLANTYYQAMANKDIGGVASLLHPDVRLIGPLGEVAGICPSGCHKIRSPSQEPARSSRVMALSGLRMMPPFP
jgi:hypothetical protein